MATRSSQLTVKASSACRSNRLDLYLAAAAKASEGLKERTVLACLAKLSGWLARLAQVKVSGAEGEKEKRYN